ncbi:BtrH N-terminal domain-containing protein [Streptomyces paradoxus]|uniref:BtrH N-terminal domain-containing protein n=1 Tax=Streptomyces paradoxus TaxID=66375 RepID=UPI00363E0A4A
MTATAPLAAAAIRPSQAARRPPTFYRDPVSCLQSVFGALLADAGHDPVAALGARWEFRHIPGDVRPEEFYYPERSPGDVAATLMPYHPVRSAWSVPTTADPLGELAELIDGGVLPIAAVDNYHLPFRPAFHDVHAAHLVLVFGVDRTRGLVLVSDTMPPAFSGAIRAEDFLDAWGSSNPADDQDAFFSDAGIGRRYLTLDIGAPWPADDPAALAAALRANDTDLHAEPSPDTGQWTGLAGLRRYVEHVVEASRAGDGDVLKSVYTFGWGQQAMCSLHGELLRGRGHAWAVPALREAGRQVEAAAHTWSGLRLTAAHGWPDPVAAADDMHRHGTRLCRRYEAAATAASKAVTALAQPPR